MIVDSDNRSESSTNNNNNYGVAIPEFRFPLRKEILCDQPADNRFWVTDRLNVSTWIEDKLMKELETVSDKLCSGSTKCLQIMENDIFDIFYSYLYYFEEIPTAVRKDLISHLNLGLRFLLKMMEKKQVLTMDVNIDHRKSL